MSTPIPLPRLGVDFVSDETQMPAGTVRAAVNVDIDRVGQYRRRGGWYSASAAPGWSSLHAWGGALVAQRGAQVLRIDPDSLAEQVLAKLGTDAAVDFAEYNGDLYLCHPTGLLRLRAGESEARPAGARLPDALPEAVAAGVGTLGPGRYMVAVALVDESGEESPAALLGALQLSGGLRLEGLAVLPGCRWRAYVTPPDGDVLYLAEEFEAVWPQYAVTVYPGGAPCETLHRASMPGGQFVRGWAGRLYVASGDTLWYSDALRPHITAPRHNFVRFVGAIRFIEFVTGGAFVGDDRGVWWLAGNDPTAWNAELASKAQPVARSSVLVPANLLGVLESRSTRECAVWLSTEGHMVGAADGSVSALNSDRIRIAPGQSGRSVFLQRDGIAQVITLTAAPGPAHVFGVAVDTKGIPS